MSVDAPICPSSRPGTSCGTGCYGCALPDRPGCSGRAHTSSRPGSSLAGSHSRHGTGSRPAACFRCTRPDTVNHHLSFTMRAADEGARVPDSAHAIDRRHALRLQVAAQIARLKAVVGEGAEHQARELVAALPRNRVDDRAGNSYCAVPGAPRSIASSSIVMGLTK